MVEYAEDYPGVSVLPQPVRIYPEGALAGHLLGYIGDPNEDDIAKPGISPTDRVGRAGVERQYDDQLRGTPGAIKYRIDAQQNVLDVIGEQAPAPGDNLVLTVDLDVQRMLESSLADGLKAARDGLRPRAAARPTTPGARCGRSGSCSTSRTARWWRCPPCPATTPTCSSTGSASPSGTACRALAVFNNFAIQGEYAPASTFKSVAYVLALEEGLFALEGDAQHTTPATSATGSSSSGFTDGSPQVLNDWISSGHGEVDLHTGLQILVRSLLLADRPQHLDQPAGAPRAGPSPRTCSSSGPGASGSTSRPASTCPSSRTG